MSRRVIDLSQPLSGQTRLHPFLPTGQILRQIVHADAAPGRNRRFDFYGFPSRLEPAAGSPVRAVAIVVG